MRILKTGMTDLLAIEPIKRVKYVDKHIYLIPHTTNIIDAALKSDFGVDNRKQRKGTLDE
ncbi:hypothetical protein [Mesorhizobium sp. SP-1A]|uniref:hypothetical protein n=1 Tax=Mesorhizobium sp. SP-1A TaxID=3077840 RepID=UPI0028F6ED28|nr:hypothetical protein [Mesorhizobium sp. SP-1A]